MIESLSSGQVKAAFGELLIIILIIPTLFIIASFDSDFNFGSYDYRDSNQ